MPPTVQPEAAEAPLHPGSDVIPSKPRQKAAAPQAAAQSAGTEGSKGAQAAAAGGNSDAAADPHLAEIEALKAKLAALEKERDQGNSLRKPSPAVTTPPPNVAKAGHSAQKGERTTFATAGRRKGDPPKGAEGTPKPGSAKEAYLAKEKAWHEAHNAYNSCLARCGSEAGVKLALEKGDKPTPQEQQKMTMKRMECTPMCQKEVPQYQALKDEKLKMRDQLSANAKNKNAGWNPLSNVFQGSVKAAQVKSTQAKRESTGREL